MLHCEFRPGSQHCQNGMPEFLKRTLALADAIRSEYPPVFRLDGGSDAIENLRVLHGAGRYFLLKRNLRKENPEEWLERAQSLGMARNEDLSKVVYTGTLTKRHPKADPDMPDFDIFFQVTKRTIDREGNLLLVPHITGVSRGFRRENFASSSCCLP
jgi:hypothetical protein